jgi:hypothetical protein
MIVTSLAHRSSTTRGAGHWLGWAGGLTAAEWSRPGTGSTTASRRTPPL